MSYFLPIIKLKDVNILYDKNIIFSEYIIYIYILNICSNTKLSYNVEGVDGLQITHEIYHRILDIYFGHKNCLVKF